MHNLCCIKWIKFIYIPMFISFFEEKKSSKSCTGKEWQYIHVIVFTMNARISGQKLMFSISKLKKHENKFSQSNIFQLNKSMVDVKDPYLCAVVSLGCVIHYVSISSILWWSVIFKQFSLQFMGYTSFKKDKDGKVIIVMYNVNKPQYRYIYKCHMQCKSSIAVADAKKY